MELWSVVRLVRAATFAATCAGLAAGGHLAAGGAVEPLVLAIGFAAMFVPALLLTRRERSIGTILPAVALCQVVLHLLLSGSSPAHGMTTTADGMTAHGMSAASDGSPGLSMLLAHAIAVLITSWWLERGEAGLCALVRCVATWALRSLTWLRPTVVHGPAWIRSVFRGRHPRPAQALKHAMVRRGPPAGHVALV
ncbi:MFS transporter [Actinomadura litoris]|uniref:MFS transporter n=1 Tax=Actinomadura litoris TaxID=2678616 RepID=A0A7K1KU15_9ACTN|nr:MFS transporter [Actinomadura litoris]MUN35497.1 MFS transporter [Actinomadura litoris]